MREMLYRSIVRILPLTTSCQWIILSAEDEMYKPTEEELTKWFRKMKNATDPRDPEAAHVKCDAVLCDLLRELGFGVVVDTWKKQKRWYS